MGGLGNSKFTQEIAIAVQHKMYLSNYTPFFFSFLVNWLPLNGVSLMESDLGGLKKITPFNTCSWLWEKWLWVPLQKARSSFLGNRGTQSRLCRQHFFLRNFPHSQDVGMLRATLTRWQWFCKEPRGRSVRRSRCKSHHSWKLTFSGEYSFLHIFTKHILYTRHCICYWMLLPLWFPRYGESLLGL